MTKRPDLDYLRLAAEHRKLASLVVSPAAEEQE